MAQNASEILHNVWLNSDDRRHPLVNSLVTVTCVLGTISTVFAGFPSLHAVSVWTGLVGIVSGGWGQYISVTTSERFALILSLAMCGVGFYIGMAHGAFW
ncbi:hypothetical protein ACFO3J_22045 [Streptomyces polygonati]|uniref:Integral membrane protein n=1 Tax=Streptomyces polygonati TaxID=1617087 RepID=A0ABV8HTA4_9ACTN